MNVFERNELPLAESSRLAKLCAKHGVPLFRARRLLAELAEWSAEERVALFGAVRRSTMRPESPRISISHKSLRTSREHRPAAEALAEARHWCDRARWHRDAMGQALDAGDVAAALEEREAFRNMLGKALNARQRWHAARRAAR